MNPAARVARASESPPSRSDGRATTSPKAQATTAPKRAAGRNGTPWAVASAAIMAPRVTKAAWASGTSPPAPVITTNDRNTMAVAIPCAARRALNDEVVWIQATRTTRLTVHGSARRHGARSAR